MASDQAVAVRGGSALPWLLRSERLRRGWSHERCAAEVGVSQATWTRWEQGSHPGDRHAGRIGDFLGVPTSAALRLCRGRDEPDEVDPAVLAEAQAAVAAQARQLRAQTEQLAALRAEVRQVTQSVGALRDLLRAVPGLGVPVGEPGR